MGGVGATAASTILFAVWASLDGQTYPCRLQADFTGHERILGRDVLNRLDILFRGPQQEVVINPGGSPEAVSLGWLSGHAAGEHLTNKA